MATIEATPLIIDLTQRYPELEYTAFEDMGVAVQTTSGRRPLRLAVKFDTVADDEYTFSFGVYAVAGALREGERLEIRNRVWVRANGVDSTIVTIYFPES